jgi:hypothetical protein
MEAIRHRLLTAFFRDLRPVCPNCQAVIPPWAKLHVLPYPTNENEAAPPTERSGAGHADLLDACALKIRCGDERPCRCRLQLHIRAPGGDPIFALAKSATMKHHNVCDLDLSSGASTTFKAIPRRGGLSAGRVGQSEDLADAILLAATNRFRTGAVIDIVERILPRGCRPGQTSSPLQ